MDAGVREPENVLSARKSTTVTVIWNIDLWDTVTLDRNEALWRFFPATSLLLAGQLICRHWATPLLSHFIMNRNIKVSKLY